MHTIDWLIMSVPLIICFGIALYTRRYVKSVADFMAGGRNAGRFLICTAKSEMGFGAVMFVAMFEQFYKSGLTLSWWKQLAIPVGLMVSISGFVVYRYRQTRALTLAQFFEMRYSRRFRLFSGVLAFFAGLMNFGIIPCVGARFMVYFLGFPATTHLFAFDVPTHLVLMACFLSVCVLMTTAGGQLTILVTDCAEGMFSQISYVIVAVALLFLFSWSQTREALLSRPPGQSLVNPFDSFGTSDFNLWYELMMMSTAVYATMAWQNSHAFNASASSPHESRMGGILGRWRGFAGGVMVTLLAVTALTYLNRPEGAANVQGVIDHIASPRIAGQMRVPIALSLVLPVGVKGLLCAVILMGLISSDGMHLHSWSSILIQDVILPLRKKPLSQRQHLRLLRLSVAGVALWAFCFGALFTQTEYVSLWFRVTEAIFIGGAGSAIIGGLYWSRGTAAGAWTALIAGSGLSVTGILLRQAYPHFPLNGMQVSFAATLVAITSYVLVSLLTCKQPHNMDRLLHRGQYAVEPEGYADQAVTRVPSFLDRILGMNEHFTRGDRWITVGAFYWSMTWFTIFVVGSLAYLIHPWPAWIWADYWFVAAICLPLLVGILTTVWFTIGCWHDMRVFFQRLRIERVDEGDDGTVDHGADSPVEGVPEAPAVAAIGASQRS